MRSAGAALVLLGRAALALLGRATVAILASAALAQDPPPPPPPPDAALAEPAAAPAAAGPSAAQPAPARPDLGPPGAPAAGTSNAVPAPAVAPPAGYQRCVEKGAARFERAKPARPAVPTETTPPVGDDEARGELEAAIKGYEDEARAYRSEIQQIVQKQFDERRRFTGDHYEKAIKDLEVLERSEREAAIARFEEFVRRYPDDPIYTPDAMFRLAELHYEQANDDFDAAVARQQAEAQRALAEGREPPPEPLKSYARSIALYQRIITGFPDYKFGHGVQYLLAYCLGEMGQGEEAVAAYRALIERHPDSAFVPEAWVRLGDWYFDEVKADSLKNAADAFARVYGYPEHPLYARAIYKLGWTYYRMDDFANAVGAFTKLLDHYVAEAERTGQKPGSGDVWPEAVQYTAISFADEKWGGVDKAKAYYASLGGRPYEPEIYRRLGDVFFEETKYSLAVAAYKAFLEKEPLSPEAPAIQGKIVLAWSRDRQFDKEAAEREALVAAYQEGTPWWEKNQGDPELVAGVRELSEKSLLRAASFHHAQAQAYKGQGKLEAAVAEYRIASTAYGDYLARFPHSKQAHELTYNWADTLYNALEFEKAARIYALVRDDPAGDKFRAEAATSAVISWEGEITRLQRAGQLQERKVLLSTDRKEKELPKAEPIPPVLEHFVGDSDAMVGVLPGHEKAPAFAYRAAEVFYKYNDYDEARCRFEEVVARWPSSEVATFAANLIIESHLTMRDWDAVEQASARLQGDQVGKNKTLQATLQKFKLGGRFQRAMLAMDAKQWEPAAQLFLALVAEEPKHEFADKALFNAAACYEGARRFESALKLYERIYAEYPKSALADEALFRVGFNAENTYEFEKAVGRYLQLVEKYPKSKHRKDALYNAARSLENLQRYDEAAPAFVRYARTYPDAEDAARTLFHAALVYEKTDDYRRETAALQDFVKRYARTKEHELVVQAHLELGLAQKKLKDDRAAQASYRAAVREFAARGLRPEGHPRAAAAAAEARFRLAEYDFEKYDRITLPATSNTNKLKRALQAKLGEAKKVAPQYEEVMRYKRPDWILAAFYRKAHLLERLAQTIYEAPPPPEFKRRGAEEYLAAYQDGLAQFAQPYEEQAVKVYIDAIEAARKLHVKNEWTKKIGESLARYRPREYPVLKEAKARMVTEEVTPLPFADTPEGPSRRTLPGAGTQDASGAAGMAAPAPNETPGAAPATN